MNKEEIKQTVTDIRHHLHTIPELALQEYKTSAYIAEKMREFGFDVTAGIGGTGVVATLKCGDSDEMIGLRADFDALPITEDSDLPYRSMHEGCFHGCGHDSHAASLIGAALLLKESRNFNGTAVFIFQPGEEPGVGARAMLDDGLLEKFPIREIYGQHNDPLTPVGRIGVRPGMASSSEDDFWITIRGKGGHASAPHNTKDPLVTACEVVNALQTIVSRNINPLEAGTVSCCDIQTDGVLNAIPSTVTIVGDCRTYNKAVQKLIEERMRTIVQHICEMNGCEWELRYDHAFVPLDNDPGCVQKDDAEEVLRRIMEADLLIYATPIYTWYCTAEMKALLDRQYCLNKYYGSAQGQLIPRLSVALITTHGYVDDYANEPFETGIQRLCRHCHWDYLGRYSVRDIDGLVDMQTENAVEGAKQFAESLMEKLK